MNIKNNSSKNVGNFDDVAEILLNITKTGLKYLIILIEYLSLVVRHQEKQMGYQI